jgi:hypothetical protein
MSEPTTPAPRVVTTVEELEALPVNTPFFDADGDLLQVVEFECQDGQWDIRGHHCVWAECTGIQRWYNGLNSSSGRDVVHLPATVLTPAPEPTVKPDREAEFKTYLSCIEEEEPEIQRLAKYDKHTLRTIFNAGFDVAVAEGRTEREVAEAAWDEGRQSLALDMGNPLREDMTRESTANPYRAKGASDG